MKERVNMKNGPLTKIFLVGALVLIIYVKFFREETLFEFTEFTFEDDSETLATPKEKTIVKNNKKVIVNNKKISKNNKIVTRNVINEKNNLEIKLSLYELNQKKIINEFIETTQMNFALPSEMNYTNLDMDEGIVGLYGSDVNKENELSIMATHKNININDVLEYIIAEEGMLPNVKRGDFSLDSEVSNLPIPSGKGISMMTLVKGKAGAKRGSYGVLIKRMDGKGSYFFVMKAPNELFSENEGSLDKLLDSLQFKSE